MDVDSLIVKLGGFGRYQLFKYMSLALFAIFDGLQTFSIVLVAAKTKFECSIDHDNSTAVFGEFNPDDIKELSYTSDDSCKMLNTSDVLDALYHANGNVSVARDNLLTNVSSIACTNGYTFLAGQYKTSIVSEFDLVCDREILRTIAQASWMVGKFIGLIITGRLSDRFGRKKAFIGCLIFTAVFGLGASAAPNVYIFYCCFLLHGSLGSYYVAFTLATELVGPGHRVLTGTGVAVFFGVGYALLAPLAYFVQNWRYLLIIINLPCLLFIGYWWVLDESLRWLLVKDKDNEAKKMLQKIAKTNKTTLPDDTILQLKKGLLADDKQKVKMSIIDLFRNRKMAFLTVAIWYNWIIQSLVYYGFSFNTDSLVGNIFVNIAITAGCQMAGSLVCILLVNKIGRKKLLLASMFTAGISCLLGGLLKGEHMLVVFSMIGKLAITSAFSTIYLVTAEIFPTETRNLAITGSAVVSKIGGISSPFILQLQTIWAALPFIILGVTSLVASALTIFLPETSGTSLPQTIDEVIRMTENRQRRGDKQKGYSDC